MGCQTQGKDTLLLKFYSQTGSYNYELAMTSVNCIHWNYSLTFTFKRRNEWSAEQDVNTTVKLK